MRPVLEFSNHIQIKHWRSTNYFHKDITVKIPSNFRWAPALGKKREHLTGGAIGGLKEFNSKTGAEGMTSGFQILSGIYSATVSRRDISLGRSTLHELVPGLYQAIWFYKEHLVSGHLGFTKRSLEKRTKSWSMLHREWAISATCGRRINSREDLKTGSHALCACFGIKLFQATNCSPCEVFCFFPYAANMKLDPKVGWDLHW